MYDGNIPVNVSVDFDELTSEGSISPDMITDAYANLSEVQTDIKEYNQTLDSLKSLIIEERSKEKIDLETLSELYTQYFDALGIEAPIFENDGKLISDAEIEKLQKDYEAFKTKYGNINVENYCQQNFLKSISNSMKIILMAKLQFPPVKDTQKAI